MTKKRWIILGIVLTFFLVIGVSYAYWYFTKEQSGFSNVTSGCIDVEIISNSKEIKLENAYPLLNSEGVKLTPYTFTITNTCSLFVSYDITLSMLSTSTLESQYIAAGILFIIASLTDFLDGYLARKNNQVTDLGKMLDAIADKILVNPILIILACQGFIHVIVPIVVVLRDIFVNAVKMQAASSGKVVAAIKSGKIKTATLMVGTVLAFFYNMPFEFISLNVTDFLLLIGTVMSIISAIQYFLLNKDLIFSKTETL